MCSGADGRAGAGAGHCACAPQEVVLQVLPPPPVRQQRAGQGQEVFTGIALSLHTVGIQLPVLPPPRVLQQRTGQGEEVELWRLVSYNSCYSREI